MSRTKFSIANGIQASALVTTPMRARLLRWYGIACGNGTRVYEGVFFGSSKVRLGADCFVSVGCFIDGSDWVDIGAHVHLGSGVRLLTSSHDIGPSERRAGPNTTAPVRLEAGCWLGAGVLVMPGVTIARGCVVAAGAVVTTDTLPDGIYAGVPARRLRELA